MKAKLTFDLPEDEHEFYCANKGKDMFAALWDLSQELRTMCKYQTFETNEEYAIVEAIRDKFYEILNENEINLNK